MNSPRRISFSRVRVRRTTARMRLLFLCGGRTGQGRLAAASHTGAIASRRLCHLRRGNSRKSECGDPRWSVLARDPGVANEWPLLAGSRRLLAVMEKAGEEDAGQHAGCDMLSHGRRQDRRYDLLVMRRILGGIVSIGSMTCNACQKPKST